MFENIKVIKVKKVIDKDVLKNKIIVGIIILLVANFIRSIVSLLYGVFGTSVLYGFLCRINYIYNIEHFRVYLNFGLIIVFILSSLFNRKFNVYAKSEALLLKILRISFMIGLPTIIIWVARKYMDYLGHDGFGETILAIGILTLLFNIASLFKGE